MSEPEALIRELVGLLAAVMDGTAQGNEETRDLLKHVDDWLKRQGRRHKPFTVIPGGKETIQ